MICFSSTTWELNIFNKLSLVHLKQNKSNTNLTSNLTEEQNVCYVYFKTKLIKKFQISNSITICELCFCFFAKIFVFMKISLAATFLPHPHFIVGIIIRCCCKFVFTQNIIHKLFILDKMHAFLNELSYRLFLD